MTAEEAMALLPEWQERLRLRDWNIRISVSQRLEGAMGDMRMVPKYKSAEIRLGDLGCVDPDSLANGDPEITLVHELLHVQAAFLTTFLREDANARYYDEMERLVELTASALVNLKRRAA
jgi:hypothetical protein